MLCVKNSINRRLVMLPQHLALHLLIEKRIQLLRTALRLRVLHISVSLHPVPHVQTSRLGTTTGTARALNLLLRTTINLVILVRRKAAAVQ